LKQAWKFLYWPIAWMLSLYVPYYYATGPWKVLEGPVGVLLRTTGLVVVVYSLFLTSIGGRTLRLLAHTGRSGFWPDRLVVIGVYNCMRHPQHLGLALFPVGLALLAASPVAIIGSGWSVAAALLFVLIVEEPECISKYGDEYYRYMMRTPPFSLDPRCIVRGIMLLRQTNVSQP
jgi:protein-S-isoprenylcysteine O-methyltransferase Ste14